MAKKNRRPKQKEESKPSNRFLLKRFRLQYANAEKDKAETQRFLNAVDGTIQTLRARIAALERDWPLMEKKHDEASARLRRAKQNISTVEKKARAEVQLAKIQKQVRDMERAEREEAQASNKT